MRAEYNNSMTMMHSMNTKVIHFLSGQTLFPEILSEVSTLMKEPRKIEENVDRNGPFAQIALAALLPRFPAFAPFLSPKVSAGVLLRKLLLVNYCEHFRA